MKAFKKILASAMAVMSLSTALCIPSSYASSTGTFSESESNNTFNTANTVDRDNVIISGKISSASDVDYYRLLAKTAGYIDITLSVPNGRNYNFYVYGSDKSSIIAYGNANGTGKGEIARIHASTNSPFYIKVQSASGYSASTEYKLYVSSGKGVNKTWYSQWDNTLDYGDYNINNLPTGFTNVMKSGGCAICSIAMVLHNMNAHTKDDITDNRTGFVGKQYADPLTVYMARNNLTVQPNSASSSTLELQYDDNGQIRYIGEYFNKKITRKTDVTLSTVKAALNSNPYGVVVRLKKGSDSHYVVFYKASNSDGFVVYDPGTGTSSKGNGVTFNNSYAAINRSFTTDNISELITIS